MKIKFSREKVKVINTVVGTYIKTIHPHRYRALKLPDHVKIDESETGWEVELSESFYETKGVHKFEDWCKEEVKW